MQSHAYGSALPDTTYSRLPSTCTAGATIPHMEDLRTGTASAEQIFPLLDAIEDQIDWLVSPDGSFRNFLESQLSRVSSPTQYQ